MNGFGAYPFVCFPPTRFPWKKKHSTTIFGSCSKTPQIKANLIYESHRLRMPHWWHFFSPLRKKSVWNYLLSSPFDFIAVAVIPIFILRHTAVEVAVGSTYQEVNFTIFSFFRTLVLSVAIWPPRSFFASWKRVQPTLPLFYLIILRASDVSVDRGSQTE